MSYCNSCAYAANVMAPAMWERNKCSVLNDSIAEMERRPQCPSLRIRESLCEATENGQTELISSILCDSRYDLDSLLNSPYPRPLFAAMYHGNLALVELFLKHGSSVTLFSECPNPQYVSYLWTWFHSMSAIEYACYLDRPDMLELLYVYYSEPYEGGVMQKSLHYAVLHGAFDCVRYLLTGEAGFTLEINLCIDVEAHTHQTGILQRRKGRMKVTPLMLGLIHGCKMVQILLDAGASVMIETTFMGSWNESIGLLNIAALRASYVNKDGKQFELTAIVQLLIDAGASLNSTKDDRYHTPFESLMDEIRNSEFDKRALTSADIAAYLETMQLLIGDVSNIDEHTRIQKLSMMLISSLYDLNCRFKERRWINCYASLRKQIFQIIARAVKVILKQGGRLIDEIGESYIINLLRYAGGVAQQVLEDRIDASCVEHCHDIIIILSDVVRYLVLAMVGRDRSKSSNKFVDLEFKLDKTYDVFEKSYVFLLPLMYLAEYSSTMGRSNVLIHLFLNFVSANELKTLYLAMHQPIETFTDAAIQYAATHYPFEAFLLDRIPSAIKNVLEKIEEVETPLRLEHLARCAVAKAMSPRSLDDSSAAGLGLPEHLQAYVQFKDVF